MADAYRERALPTLSVLERLRCLRREHVPYASHYCEENAYKLVEALYRDFSLPDHAVFAVFISNDCKSTPVWKQRLGNGRCPLMWDYHVITLVNVGAGDEGGMWAFDQDTTLPFPCEGLRYIEESFHPEMQLDDKYRQRFRVVPGRDYLEYFSSDRSHMKDFDAAQPPWPLIRGCRAPSDMRLGLYVDVHQSSSGEDVKKEQGCGKILSIAELISFVSP
ncbi:hypothetical protein, conserved [Trypanosoma brucei brucei TREU927]|uniref:Protein N-terminal glutamine amidohydrolase n=1 Tax=Trypanosoma brucei brucei (strain 927/4 GUTat10.1) TaxID=185431 RepID=Q38AX8_TRYB2|nr:hypothetical protein, conserved [Trypanosoma brucei brucei TREU927]EAN78042.1 hypothetical protein, conserved [Trypanosoma brucei brucei TREU927]